MKISMPQKQDSELKLFFKSLFSSQADALFSEVQQEKAI